jgi:hypothetical protein
MGSEDNAKKKIYKLNTIALRYNMKISRNKTIILAFNGKHPIRAKTATDGNVTEQANVLII